MKQAYRYLNEIGFGILLVAIFVLTGVLFSLLQSLLTTPALAAIPMALVVLTTIEFKRKDQSFLKSIFDSKQAYLNFRFIENTIILSPILIFQAIFLRWDIILIILVLCGLMTFASLFMKFASQQERKSRLDFIPLSLFEIKFYIEKNKWSVVFIWLLMMCGVFHFSLWILGIIFLCMMFVEIYSPQESREMLRFKPHFVRKKLIIGLQFFLLFISIPTVATYFRSEMHYIIVLYGLLALLFSLTLAISKKYVSYYGVVEYVPSTTATVILILLMLAPGGILVTLTAAIYYYFKAEHHIKELYAII